MTADKQRGAYTITSVTFTPGPAHSVLAQVSFEGTAPGYGIVLGTNTFVVGKSGTYSGCAACYLDDGEIRTYTSRGTYDSSGHHTWRLHEVGQFSDGQAVEVEAEIDVAARTLITKY